VPRALPPNGLCARQTVAITTNSPYRITDFLSQIWVLTGHMRLRHLYTCTSCNHALEEVSLRKNSLCEVPGGGGGTRVNVWDDMVVEDDEHCLTPPDAEDLLVRLRLNSTTTRLALVACFPSFAKRGASHKCRHRLMTLDSAVGACSFEWRRSRRCPRFPWTPRTTLAPYSTSPRAPWGARAR